MNTKHISNSKNPIAKPHKNPIENNKISKKPHNLSTVADLLQWATDNNRAVCAFNVNNMELIQAVTDSAASLNVPIILQVSKGARNYAGMTYITKLVEAALLTHPNLRVALHLDHGDSFELCKECLDNGFTSVMIDGSHLPFEENIALTKRVVDYAKKFGACVEGELGLISGIEEEKNPPFNFYTDPKVCREYVERTGVTSLAISIGTAHGAHKYKPGSTPELRLDILAEIQRAIPNTPLVLHGASSIPQNLVTQINQHGGDIKNALGVSEEYLSKTIPLGVRKINIDSDLRLAFTAALRKHMTSHPCHFDPRQYLTESRKQVQQVVLAKLQAFSLEQK